MFAYWGLFTWIPGYLSLPVEKGGAGMTVLKSSTWIVLMQVGAWFGYVTFGFIADALGRRGSFALYFLICSVLVPLFGRTRDPLLLLLIGPFLAFFGSGYFSGFGALLAELFPTQIRATAQGFIYNIGRGLAAFAPYTVGALAVKYGLGAAFGITSACFLLGALMMLFIPETKGRVLA
jgi:MFS family permease